MRLSISSTTEKNENGFQLTSSRSTSSTLLKEIAGPDDDDSTSTYNNLARITASLQPRHASRPDMASDDLCDMCKTISITSLAYLGYFTHYRSSVFQLEETRTCPLCALIWEALRSDWDRPGIEDLLVRLLLNPPNLAQGPINHLEVVIARHELFETRLWSPGSASPTIPELLIGPPDRYEVPRSQLEISAVLGW